jgi:ABC-type sugar transport system ATPase subunit
VLETREIIKDFGGTRALDRVSFAVRPGEVHALVGENGAGKSTLMKIISGALKPDSGTIHLQGHAIHVDNPHHALQLGISIVHQQSGLVPDLTVAENIFLGRMPKTRLGLVDWKKLYRDAIVLLRHLDFGLDVHRSAGDLDAASRQVTEIARALSVSAQVLIMDEPSAVLGPSELDKLFRIIRKLKAEGKTIIYVSHRLREIFQIADRVTVLKDGNLVGTFSLDGRMDPSFLIRKMVDGGWVERSLEIPAAEGDERLRVEDLTRKGAFENISFQLHAGEVLGLAGLVGAGRTDLCKAIFGATTHDSGRIYVEGRPVHIHSPRDALAHGVAYLSKDRHNEGLILGQSIGKNVTLPILHRFTSRGILNLGQENRFVDKMIDKMNIRARGRNQLTANLSGGNQQKVALAKWLSTQARVFLLDEPTVGIDVGAKSQIYQLVAELARKGGAILLVSSEIPEILSLCNRIIVMSKGHITGHLRSQVATEEDVLQLAT